MSSRDLRLPLVAAALILGAVAAVLAGGIGAELLVFMPALLVLAPLLGGSYVGERTLRRLAVRFSRPRRARRSPATRPSRPVFGRAAAGGRLLAERLAGRAPPHAGPLTVR